MGEVAGDQEEEVEQIESNMSCLLIADDGVVSHRTAAVMAGALQTYFMNQPGGERFAGHLLESMELIAERRNVTKKQKGIMDYFSRD